MSAPLRVCLALALLTFTPPARAELATATLLTAPQRRLPIAFARAHGLGRGLARQRVQELLEYWGERFGVQGVWQGDTARIVGQLFGIDFEARLVVRESEVAAQASDPGFFLRGPAIDYINRKLGKYLDPDYQES